MSKKPGDYEVGHGRPPKKHQFQKGRSGNPRGRPKKNESIAELVVKLLDERIQVRTKDGSFTMTTREAIVRQLIQRAATGDLRQTKMIVDLVAMNDQASKDNQRQYGVILAPASIDIETGFLRIEDVEDDH